MLGNQAKPLTRQQLVAASRRMRSHRYPQKGRVMLLLSAKAGLRAGEIAKLTWPMVLDARGQLGDRIELADRAAKNRSGRTIPLHPQLKRALQQLRTAEGRPKAGPVIRSERGCGDPSMRPGSIVNWVARLYRELGYQVCSSHSGRRTFVTHAARLVFKAGGSLRDVQQLAGHRSIEQTQTYIDDSERAKRRLIALM